MGTPNSELEEILKRLQQDTEGLAKALGEKEAKLVATQDWLIEALVQVIKPVLKYVDKEIPVTDYPGHGEKYYRGLELPNQPPGPDFILTRGGRFAFSGATNTIQPSEFRGFLAWPRTFETECEWTEQLIQSLLTILIEAINKAKERQQNLEKRSRALAAALNALKSA